MPKFNDRTGQVYGRLTVLAFEDRVGNEVRWRCLCECGNEKVVRAAKLASGNTSSCGCFRQETTGRQARRHGGAGTSEHRSWKAMRNRCLNPRGTNWESYGGRGITICDRWESFDVFLKDMGPRPSPGHSLDRIDVNGNYEPSNCRWATQAEQVANRRPPEEWPSRKNRAA